MLELEFEKSKKNFKNLCNSLFLDNKNSENENAILVNKSMAETTCLCDEWTLHNIKNDLEENGYIKNLYSPYEKFDLIEVKQKLIDELEDDYTYIPFDDLIYGDYTNNFCYSTNVMIVLCKNLSSIEDYIFIAKVDYLFKHYKLMKKCEYFSPTGEEEVLIENIMFEEGYPGVLSYLRSILKTNHTLLNN